ncbi:MAG: MnhB domain-containing protein [Lachnospiraceae bacterium]|nr:MnhB domain-containing protein [Lachnospiraceae bacterium]
MSKKKPDFEYERTGAYKFFKWLSGEEDPYVGKVEMKPQRVKKTSKETIQDRMAEKRMRRDKVYEVEDNRIVKGFNKLYYLVAIIFLVVLFITLVDTVSFLPPVGQADKAVNNEVPARYIENGLQETGSVNIVTGMILDYRAFDTLGESNVLFVATITVLILLQASKGKRGAVDYSMYFEPLDDAILRASATILVPVIAIFGIYVVLNGHLSPGGGFSGGAIIGSALILYQNAYGFKKAKKLFNEKTYKTISAVALATYCCCKMYSFFTGANHLESHIPLGVAGHILSSGLILILNICVGMVVSCTMYAFYVMFRKGDF